MTRKE